MKIGGIKVCVYALTLAEFALGPNSSPAQVDWDCNYLSRFSAGFSDPDAFLNGGWINLFSSWDVPSDVIAHCVDIGVLGVDGRVTEVGYSVLHWAVLKASISPENLNRELPIIRALLRAGADPNTHHTLGGGPLHIAVNASEPVIIAELIEAGANSNARTESGYTPLHFAVDSNSRNVAALLQAGANVDVRDDDGNTALHHWAVSDGKAEVFTELVEAGANINARSRNGWRPLHLAASQATEPRIVTLLLEAGAQANAQTENGRTPWDLAQENATLRGTDAWWKLNDARFE